VLSEDRDSNDRSLKMLAKRLNLEVFRSTISPSAIKLGSGAEELGKLSAAQTDVIYHFVLVRETELRVTPTILLKSGFMVPTRACKSRQSQIALQ
jgi:hypothetical protein